MANTFFKFKQFTIHQDRCAMKVTTDACLFGAWVANNIQQTQTAIENILDIGTGTGLLSLMVVQKNESALIDAIEIDRNAAEQALDNIAATTWKNKITVINEDVQNFSSSKKYDIILSNPPFYEKEIKSSTPEKNIAHHGEELRLEELIRLIEQHLQPDGVFYLLLPYKRNAELKNLFNNNPLNIEKIVFVRQTINHDYFRIMLKGKHRSEQDDETMIDEIAIKDEKDNYTLGFIDLLKDYYLAL